MPATAHMVHCVVCDDVRAEIANKETIVGVYTAGMTAPFVPWWATLCLWLTVMWSGDGSVIVEVRVLDPARATASEQQGTAQALWQGHESTLTFKGMIWQVNMEGVYEIQWRLNGGTWETIRQFPVYLART